MTQATHSQKTIFLPHAGRNHRQVHHTSASRLGVMDKNQKHKRINKQSVPLGPLQDKNKTSKSIVLLHYILEGWTKSQEHQGIDSAATRKPDVVTTSLLHLLFKIINDSQKFMQFSRTVMKGSSAKFNCRKRKKVSPKKLS